MSTKSERKGETIMVANWLIKSEQKMILLVKRCDNVFL